MLQFLTSSQITITTGIYSGFYRQAKHTGKNAEESHGWDKNSRALLYNEAKLPYGNLIHLVVVQILYRQFAQFFGSYRLHGFKHQVNVVGMLVVNN